jgi:HlyD family secretion protein
MSKVYVPRGGQVAAIRFRPGISDDEFTEVVSGDLHEGDEVVTDVIGGPQSSGASSGPPGAGARGRGPRLF